MATLYFFSIEPEVASRYSALHKSLYNKEDAVNSYIININNPLVVTGTNDLEHVVKAYNFLNNANIQTADINPFSSAWRNMDIANSKALKVKGYDAIMYYDNNTGKITEVILPNSSKNILHMKG